MSKIADNILDILVECRTEGNTLYLPEGQLDRATYQAVNKVLESIGGKWNRKAKGHVFADGDPAELLDNVILTGEITDLKKQYQFFPTPRPIAERMCELAELDDTCIVLEPSCGKSDLADVVFESGVEELIGLELNQEMGKYLSNKPYGTGIGVDFLKYAQTIGHKAPYTRIVMNPPFSRQQDIDHILAAYSILRPGGILVSVVSESPFFRTNKKSVEFREFLEAHDAIIEPVAEGAFKESGTMVRTRLVKIVKPPASESPVDENKGAAEDIPDISPGMITVIDEPVPSKIGQLMTQLPVDKLFPHPDNPRKDLGDLTELADSIKANGIFQNLTVVPADDSYETFTVVIGHRRLAAAKLAGLSEVPCVITEMDQKEQVRTMLLENMQRSDLTVYEQAQGFQMMLDLGSTIEEIAEKSGFSKTTVRRRVKMMELDQGMLKAVSERQLSLTDFDELAQIEDIKARNECLAQIGTSEFKRSVAEQVRQQTLKKKLPKAKKILKAAKAKALKQSDTWNGKYDSIGTSIRITDWDEESPIIPENVSGQLYYYLGEAYGDLRFYQEHKRPTPVKRPKAEIEKEKKIAEAWNQLEEKAAVAYNLRSAFVQELSWNKKTAETILRGALVAGVLKVIDYMSSSRSDMKKVLGLVDDEKAHDDTRGASALVALQELDVKQIPSLIYTLFADAATENCTWGYKGAYPKYQPSGKLNGLYAWLISLGYQMSDEEKTLLDGTHELYHRQEAEEKVKASTEEEAQQEGI
ncbi:MAG: ParB/RepB/Spo0J family partition protein [Oscillibacter sp.]|nr:ParB/RepB/Spo0J family partition protein [Oscillibacter sp.]